MITEPSHCLSNPRAAACSTTSYTPDGNIDQIKISNPVTARQTVTNDLGTVRAFSHDKLGRITNDNVSTLGTGLDGAVRRAEFGYEVRGMLERLTQWDTAGSGGAVVNEVEFAFNDFGQRIEDAQSHAGAVDGSTPMVEYAYATGLANTIRPTGLIYPNGRMLDIKYNTSGSIDDACSRIRSSSLQCVAL